MKRIVEEEQCGLTFESGNALSLSNTVLQLYRSSNHYGEKGINAVYRKYNWEEDEKRLMKIIQSMQIKI
jgi:hypothetical protein